MAYSFCAADGTALATPPVDHELWQVRAKNAGLPQKLLARLLGVSETAMSSQLRGKWSSGTPNYVKTAIRAWEMLSPEQRERLVAATEADDDGA